MALIQWNNESIEISNHFNSSPDLAYVNNLIHQECSYVKDPIKNGLDYLNRVYPLKKEKKKNNIGLNASAKYNFQNGYKQHVWASSEWIKSPRLVLYMV